MVHPKYRIHWLIFIYFILVDCCSYIYMCVQQRNNTTKCETLKRKSLNWNIDLSESSHVQIFGQWFPTIILSNNSYVDKFCFIQVPIVQNEERHPIPYSVILNIENVSTVQHSIPVDNIHARLENREQRDMGLCLSTVFGLKSSDMGFLLQSLHMKFSMGVQTIFIYGTHGNDPQINEVLVKLNSSSVQLMNYVFPDVITPGSYMSRPEMKKVNFRCTRYNAQRLQYLDCQYRNMYLYRYLALIDLDEFIYPAGASGNLTGLLDQIIQDSRRNFASLYFPYFMSCYTEETVKGLKLRKWQQGIFKGPKIRYKSIIKPELVEHFSVHKANGPIKAARGCEVDSSRVVLYHMRENCPGKPLDGAKPETPRPDDIFQLHYNATKQKIVHAKSLISEF